MTLLETVVEVTADDSWPTWVEPALLILGGVLGGLGVATIVVKKKARGAAKAAATTGGAILLALTLSGCSMMESLFGGANIDRDLAAQNLKNWQTFDKHLSDPDVLSPGWVKTAKLLTTDATDTAQRLNDKAQKE